MLGPAWLNLDGVDFLGEAEAQFAARCFPEICEGDSIFVLRIKMLAGIASTAANPERKSLWRSINAEWFPSVDQGDRNEHIDG